MSQGIFEAHLAAMTALTTTVNELNLRLASLEVGATKPVKTSGTVEESAPAGDSDAAAAAAAEDKKKAEAAAKKKAEAAAKKKPTHTVAEAQAIAREVAKHENGGAAVAREMLDGIGFTGKLSELNEEFADECFEAATKKLSEIAGGDEDGESDDF